MPPSDHTIRPPAANEHEVLTALAIRSKAHWGHAPDFIEACYEELAVRASDLHDPARVLAVAERAGTVLGFYAFEWLSPDEIDLDALFVDPPAIGCGLGGALFRHAAQTACRRGARLMSIQSDPHAAAFYQAMGAHQVGERESDSVPGRWLPLLQLRLEPA